ncbi:MAG: aspartate aminotransferase family protein [Paracoccaceae bacterium]
MDKQDYRHWAHRAADWAADYHDNIADRPVRPQVKPGDFAHHFPVAPPEAAEPMEKIFEDFARIVPDGLTHWQHPRFFAYFPANAAPASMIADQLATAMAAQCMLWQTAPIATEMEIAMVDWLRQAFGLPEDFRGVLQDTASSATMCAVLTMRERALDWAGISGGLSGAPRLRIYASPENHSSIDKAVRLSGIGQDNLVKVPVRDDRGMDPGALRAAIAADCAAGYLPAGIVAVVGGTAINAIDPVAEIVAVARDEDLYCHVDAAWAGAAMICPEFRHFWEGADGADSVVVNPHKWLGAQFECSAHFVRDPASLIRTVGLRPDYLQTLGSDDVTNFNEWSLVLGRRFRALKVWFLLRAYGLEGLRTRIRNHVAWTEKAAVCIAAIPGLEVVTPPVLGLFSFAHRGGDEATAALIEALNNNGGIYLTQTQVDGRFVIRMAVGQFDTTEADIDAACALIAKYAGKTA